MKINMHNGHATDADKIRIFFNDLSGLLTKTRHKKFILLNPIFKGKADVKNPGF